MRGNQQRNSEKKAPPKEFEALVTTPNFFPLPNEKAIYLVSMNTTKTSKGERVFSDDCNPDNKKFQATMNFLAENFKTVTVLIAGGLQKYNYAFENFHLGDDAADPYRKKEQDEVCRYETILANKTRGVMDNFSKDYPGLEWEVLSYEAVEISSEYQENFEFLQKLLPEYCKKIVDEIIVLVFKNIYPSFSTSEIIAKANDLKEVLDKLHKLSSLSVYLSTYESIFENINTIVQNNEIDALEKFARIQKLLKIDEEDAKAVKSSTDAVIARIKDLCVNHKDFLSKNAADVERYRKAMDLSCSEFMKQGGREELLNGVRRFRELTNRMFLTSENAGLYSKMFYGFSYYFYLGKQTDALKAGREILLSRANLGNSRMLSWQCLEHRKKVPTSAEERGAPQLENGYLQNSIFATNSSEQTEPNLTRSDVMTALNIFSKLAAQFDVQKGDAATSVNRDQALPASIVSLNGNHK